jgi:hypothetical protein
MAQNSFLRGLSALRERLRGRTEAKAPLPAPDEPPRPLSAEEARDRAREESSVGPPGG